MKDVKLFAAQQQHLDKIQSQIYDLKNSIIHKFSKSQDWHLFIEDHLDLSGKDRTRKDPNWHKHIQSVSFVFPAQFDPSFSKIYDSVIFNIMYSVMPSFENAVDIDDESLENNISASFGVRTLNTLPIDVDELDNFIETNYKE